MSASSKTIPIIDLFAGPGGLGEGFSAYRAGSTKFKIKLSIEKDAAAHKTLHLRSFYRQFPEKSTPKEYYEYISGSTDMPLEKLAQLYPHEWEKASKEAWLAEMGSENFPDGLVNKRIEAALDGAKEWVLIGGPPCQAYSLVGRARMKSADPQAFEKDHRHFLYKQYLRILTKFQPSVFVMENVKGILSSKIDDQLIFRRILKDLKIKGQYTIYSLSSEADEPENLKPTDFIIRAEDYGVPQARHRVILLGVRNNSGFTRPAVLKKCLGPSVHSMLRDLPRLRSHISRQENTDRLWNNALRQGAKIIFDSDASIEVKKVCKAALKGIPPSSWKLTSHKKFKKVENWFRDKNLQGVILNHEPRGHMVTDIYRYLFAACYASAMGISPRLRDFPEELLPNHRNVQKSGKKTDTFADRFKVQVASRVSSTIVSHIAKDGHYYIHPDPTQCRSLTVREAARLQTFPDNYFFQGNKTQQYAQVGNAVPPFLAVQIAEVVAKLIEQKSSRRDPRSILNGIAKSTGK